MTDADLNILVGYIRQQAGTWLGDEASESIERLISYTQLMHTRTKMIDRKLAEGFRFIQTGSGQHGTN